jgi:putative DNA primase/helicase
MSEKIQSESEAAHLFRSEYGDQIRFVPERNMWMIRDGTVWEFDQSRGIEALIRELLDRQPDSDPRWKGSLTVVRNVKGLAESDGSLHVPVTEIDTREFLIGTASGVYNLKRQKWVKPKRGYVTKRTSVDPDFESGCRKWQKFIRQVFNNDAKKIAYFQRFCGYLLTGSIKEHQLLLIYGPGGNGKSVLVNTVAKVMGAYHKEALPETFVESKSFKHETAMAFISGARFVTSGETDQGGALNEATVKRATGADMVTARFLYKNPFTYRPNYKIWVTTNHLPRLKSVGPDMRRRIQVLELDFIPKKPDHDLEQKLEKEHPAILAWMIEGARDWIEKGLNAPKGVTGSTDRYFSEQDTLGAWIAERTRTVDSAITPSSVLCESYNRFLSERGRDDIESSHFGRMLSARGYKSRLAKAHQGANRARCFIGIKPC